MYIYYIYVTFWKINHKQILKYKSKNDMNKNYKKIREDIYKNYKNIIINLITTIKN